MVVTGALRWARVVDEENMEVAVHRSTQIWPRRCSGSMKQT